MHAHQRIWARRFIARKISARAAWPLRTLSPRPAPAFPYRFAARTNASNLYRVSQRQLSYSAPCFRLVSHAVLFFPLDKSSMAAEFDKDGYLFKRVGEKKDRRIGQRKWNYYYFNLIGGSLHYYEDADVRARLFGRLFVFSACVRVCARVCCASRSTLLTIWLTSHMCRMRNQREPSSWAKLSSTRATMKEARSLSASHLRTTRSTTCSLQRTKTISTPGPRPSRVMWGKPRRLR